MVYVNVINTQIDLIIRRVTQISVLIICVYCWKVSSNEIAKGCWYACGCVCIPVSKFNIGSVHISGLNAFLHPKWHEIARLLQE